jgi:hypothetical protein
LAKEVQGVLLDILKIIGPFLGGGLAGALLNEWFRRRGARVQRIPLIERVNRVVSPELEGFTLARLTGAGQDRRLERVRNVREYQLTLRNTSTVHLQDVEIQFEFPSHDVEAWAGKPAVSKTAPVSVEAATAEPRMKGYRWRIPQFPSSDSVEFTFRAVDPATDDYEVALYKSGRVVIERSKGESPGASRSSLHRAMVMMMGTAALAAVFAMSPVVRVVWPERAKSVAALNESGCALVVTSSFEQLNSGGWPWDGPWQISHRFLNAGTQRCVVDAGQLTGAPVAIESAGDFTRTLFSQTRPTLIQRDFSLGPDSATHRVRVNLYAEAQP